MICGKRFMLFFCASVLFVLICCLLLSFYMCKEHDVDFYLVGKYKTGTLFYPLAYHLCRNDEDFQSIVNGCKEMLPFSEMVAMGTGVDSVITRRVNSVRKKEYDVLIRLSKEHQLDFNRYAYVFVRGNSVKRMFYSWFTTLYKDRYSCRSVWKKRKFMLCLEYVNGANSYDVGDAMKHQQKTVGTVGHPNDDNRGSDGYMYVYRIPKNTNVERSDIDG